MAVSLPTSADVRKVRSQATKAVNTQLDVVKTPLLAWVGAGDLAVTKAGEVVDKAKARATERRALAAERRERLQAQIKDLPTELRETLSAEELKKRYEELTAEAKTRYEDVTGEVKKAYTELADRGEVTVEKIRKQPRVKRVLDGVADANDELEKRVEKAVDDLHDAGEEVLGKVSTQTRSVGEKAARATQKFTSEAAESVTEAGNDLAAEVKEAGTEAAATTRSVTRKAANRTAPKKPAAKRTNASSVK
ncbi:MAG TPA: hypothetical protein VL595_33980 [Pseudonocardia sp.]|jgi:heparin binding hemagglutinin HbhA|nr:hypothetical protein [Pseudonocardia sp.]